MTTREIFDFVSKQKSNNGIVINPASDRWTMNAEQIELFVKDNYWLHNNGDICVIAPFQL